MREKNGTLHDDCGVILKVFLGGSFMNRRDALDADFGVIRHQMSRVIVREKVALVVGSRVHAFE